ncbi:TonB-dependent receptor [Gemmatimonas sp.]|uniref:TonB-dependent receptor n=1 Tax=Gemmatimonas sp. TaxID=1962908 RepID=UPI003DA6988C
MSHSPSLVDGRRPVLPSRVVVTLLLPVACLWPQANAKAQGATGSLLRGQVQLANGSAPPPTTVSLLDTQEQTTTDSLGRFALRTMHRGVATLVARRVGFIPATVDIEIPCDTALRLTLVPMPPSLTAMTVVAAGEYTLGSGRTASLTPLEVAQTPGAAANVAKALQTLPGPQNVDEGSGLFVRGGDVTETRVLLDDAWLLSPARFDNPIGHVTATVNPFLLDRTVFSAGGSGAQYGNALSGMVRMETAGRPLTSTGNATASIGSAGLAAALAPHRRLGIRANANIRALAPLIAVFGEAQPYAPPPEGGDVSGTLEWQSGKAGRIRLFALRDDSRFGVGNAGVPTGTVYTATTGQNMLVLSWRDSASTWRPAFTVARSSVNRAESIETLRLGTQLGVIHAVAAIAWQPDGRLHLRIGGDLERLNAQYTGALRDSSDTERSVTDRALFDARTRSDRVGAFAEATFQSYAGLRIISGVRTDRATITATRTLDPRLSVMWQRGSVGVTGALGVLHQVAEPTFYRPSEARSRFDPMRVRESILGVQWGRDSAVLRLEFYDKAYSNLWQFTRLNGVAGNARGHARGADLFLRTRLNATTRSRVAWSIVRSRRDDPDTGVDAPAIGDVRHSVSWITDRVYGRLTVSTALRYATGRPFTDIIGAQRVADVALPVYGAPNSARLPAYWRSDISASWYRPIGGGRAMVLWGDLSNLFNRGNVMRYRWNADYRERLPVRAPFNRALYAGATLLY